MLTAQKNSPLKRFAKMIPLCLMGAGVCLFASTVNAQVSADIGSSVLPAAQAAGATAQAGASGQGQASTQTSLQRGVNRAVQGAIQGQNTGDAIRSGIGEAAQSAIETNQQTQLRDQNNQLLNSQQRLNSQQQLGGQQQLSGQVQSNSNVAIDQYGNAILPQGQVWRQNSQGQLYYTDGNGQVVLRNQSQASVSGQNSGNQSAMANANANFGAQLQSTDQGLRVQSVNDGSAAAQAGLQEGDVLLRVDGQEVNSQANLNQQIRSMEANGSTELVVMRDDEEQTLTYTAQTHTADHSQQHHSQAGQDRHQGHNHQSEDVRKLCEDVEQLQKQVKDLQGRIDSMEDEDDDE